jgi:hypothetical protein
MPAYERKLAAYETFVPFTDPPTHAQMDFGEATGVLQSQPPVEEYGLPGHVV